MLDSILNIPLKRITVNFNQVFPFYRWIPRQATFTLKATLIDTTNAAPKLSLQWNIWRFQLLQENVIESSILDYTI